MCTTLHKTVNSGWWVELECCCTSTQNGTNMCSVAPLLLASDDTKAKIWATKAASSYALPSLPVTEVRATLSVHFQITPRGILGTFSQLSCSLIR